MKRIEEKVMEVERKILCRWFGGAMVGGDGVKGALLAGGE